MDGHTNTADHCNPEDPARQALLANQVLRASRDVRAAREFHAALPIAVVGSPILNELAGKFAPEKAPGRHKLKPPLQLGLRSQCDPQRRTRDWVSSHAVPHVPWPSAPLGNFLRRF